MSLFAITRVVLTGVQDQPTDDLPTSATLWIYAGCPLTGKALQQIAQRVAFTHGVRHATHPCFQGCLTCPATGEEAYRLTMFVERLYDDTPILIPVGTDCWALVESDFPTDTLTDSPPS